MASMLTYTSILTILVLGASAAAVPTTITNAVSVSNTTSNQSDTVLSPVIESILNDTLKENYDYQAAIAHALLKVGEYNIRAADYLIKMVSSLLSNETLAQLPQSPLAQLMVAIAQSDAARENGTLTVATTTLTMEEDMNNMSTLKP